MKFRLLFLLLCIALFTDLTSCRPSPRTITQVSGKTAYQGMGMENALITVYRQEPSGWQKQTETNSGYHGSFRFSVPEGTYRLVARTEVRMGTKRIPVEGTVNNLRIQGPGGRIDRVVITLQASP